MECGGGKVCPVVGSISEEVSILCESGYYCPPKNSHPMNSYSTSPYEVPCPKGTYSDTFGAEDESTCLDCPSGYACPYQGMNKYSNPLLLCSPGYYCLGKATITTPTDGITGVNNIYIYIYRIFVQQEY